jgi:uncharacterized lipoprotein
MKKLVYLIVVTFLMLGCTYKNEPISLYSYKAEYSGEKTKGSESIFISVVEDTRVDKRSIGHILENSEKTVNLYSESDFAKQYQEGLGYALNIAGFQTVGSAAEATMVLEVYIDDVKIVHTGKSFDENLKGEILTHIVLKKGDEVSTFNFKQKSGVWKTMSYSSKDLEPFLYTLFSDNINDIVSKLVTH